MIINYDVKKIDGALRDFYNATGIEIGLLRPDFTPVCERNMENIPYCSAVQSTREGLCACLASDEELLKRSKITKQTEMAVCHAGLLNTVIPLFYDGIIIGYIIFGCIKPSTQGPTDAQREMLADARMRELYEAIPSLDGTRIESVSNVAIMLAKYILLRNMLRPSFDGGIQRAIEYINDNLAGDLSIAAISRNTNTSKSVLYKSFHAVFGSTVSEYIKARRVERSIELMRSEDLSIEELSQRVGFASASYYSRVFKKHTGISPMKYKRDNR